MLQTAKTKAKMLLNIFLKNMNANWRKCTLQSLVWFKPSIFQRNHSTASERGTFFLLPGQICREEAHFCFAGLAGSRALFL